MRLMQQAAWVVGQPFAFARCDDCHPTLRRERGLANDGRMGTRLYLAGGEHSAINVVLEDPLKVCNWTAK